MISSLPPHVIKPIEKQYNVSITQKPYYKGLEEHGLIKKIGDEKVGPTGYIEPWESNAQRKKITLYTTDLPKSFQYKTLFHELQHTTGPYDDNEADRFAQNMIKKLKIKRDEDEEFFAISQMITASVIYKNAQKQLQQLKK